jgi:hypothetical protein
MQWSKFVQIALAYNEDKVKVDVFALDDAGDVWEYGFLNPRTAEHGWFPLSDKRLQGETDDKA